MSKGAAANLNFARDIMTKKVYTMHEADSLVSAWKLMRERRIRHLPISDSDGNIVGILTDRDLQRAIHTEFDQNGDVRFTIERFKSGESVGDYMTSPVRFVTYDTPLVTVATTLLEQKISCLLICDTAPPAGEVQGIITTDDLLWALVRLLKDEKEPLLRRLIDTISMSPVGPVAHQLSNEGI